MHLCLLSITYVFPYHNPTTAMGHYIPNIDKPRTYTKPYTLSAFALYSEHWEQNACPKEQTLSYVSICPLQRTAGRMYW